MRLRAFQNRLAIARTNVSLQEQTLAVVRGRFASGLVGVLWVVLEVLSLVGVELPEALTPEAAR